jgi:quinol monooxygenase YgiN
MTTPCLELVIFKIKDRAKARIARRAAQDIVRNYEGFLSWSAYEACDDAGLFADVVMWRDLPTAKAAGQKVMSDPGFKAIMAEIDGLVSMAHYAADRVVEADMTAAA